MDTLFLVLRVAVALAAVFGAIWYLQRRFGRGRAGARKAVTVVTRQSVGAKASVAVVDMDGTRFLLGVTEGRISVLHTADAPEAPEPETAALPGIAAAPAKKPTIPAPAGSGSAFEMAAGSILSPATWSRTVKALRQQR